MSEKTTEISQVGDQNSEMTLEERVRRVDEEYRRLLAMGGSPTEEFDKAIYERFNLTLENGGLDALIKYASKKKERWENERSELQAEINSKSGIKGFLSMFKKK